MALIRAGVRLSRSSVQRILREKKSKRPAAPIRREVEAALPHHILCPATVNRTWHLDLTTLEFFWLRFYVAAVLDGCSRRLLALKIYKDAPVTNDMQRLVRQCVRESGVPRFLVNDHGCQFRAGFKRGLKKLRIELVKGRKDSKRFNGKVERFFRSFKLWQRLTLFAWTLPAIQRRLDTYREWYNTERPRWLHGGRTPDEVWRGGHLPVTQPIRENDPLKPALNVSREHFHGDHNLPQLCIQIVRSVQRAA